VWRLRVFIGTDPVTGNPRQVSRTFRGTTTQADTALARFVAEITNGPVPVAPSATLADFLDRWLEQIRPNRSPTTIRGYRHKVARINRQLGTIRLDRLTARHLDRAYRIWLDEGLDPSSVHHLHRVLSAALRQAVKWGVLSVAPTARATPPPRRDEPKEIPSAAIVQQLIATAEANDQSILAVLVGLAAVTGLRRCELAGLRWDDIDFDREMLEVRRAVKNGVDGGWVVGPTKTHQTRPISLDEFTLSILRAHRVSAQRGAADAGVELGQDAYVFSLGPSGRKPITPDGLSHRFEALSKAAGVSNVTLHTLRHFSASMLLASGRDVHTIAGLLGHADASTTLRVYAHMVEDRDRDAAD
jgi:integrase